MCEWQQNNNKMLYWPIVAKTCPIKIGINLSREEVFAFKGTRFQLQQKEACSPCHRLSTIATLPILDCIILDTKPIYLPNFRFGKIVRSNLFELTSYDKNKWDNVGPMDGYYVSGVTTNSYLCIYSLNQRHLQRGHRMPCHNWQHTALHMPRLHKMSSQVIWEIKGIGCITNIFTMCLDLCAKYITIVVTSFTFQPIHTTR